MQISEQCSISKTMTPVKDVTSLLVLLCFYVYIQYSAHDIVTCATNLSLLY